jgi:hypothetical protein
MKIFLTDQKLFLAKYLEELKQTPIMEYDKNDLIEKTTFNQN